MTSATWASSCGRTGRDVRVRSAAARAEPVRCLVGFGQWRCSACFRIAAVPGGGLGYGCVDDALVPWFVAWGRGAPPNRRGVDYAEPSLRQAGVRWARWMQARCHSERRRVEGVMAAGIAAAIAASLLGVGVSLWIAVRTRSRCSRRLQRCRRGRVHHRRRGSGGRPSREPGRVGDARWRRAVGLGWCRCRSRPSRHRRRSGQRASRRRVRHLWSGAQGHRLDERDARGSRLVPRCPPNREALALTCTRDHRCRLGH